MAPRSAFETYQIQTFVRSAAIEGIGANATIRTMKDSGLAMRRSDVLSLYREYAAIPKKEEAIKYTPKKYYASQDIYTKQDGFMTKNYRYTIKYDTINPTTGESNTRYTRVISETPKTIGQVEEEAAMIQSQSDYWIGEESINYRVVLAEHSANQPW